jgi:DNA-binding response OmpR family regulator
MTAKRNTVLVVDDDEGLVQVVALTLRAAGFEVYTARNGVDGYLNYLHCPKDWVVTDIQMPKLDGFGMMRRIRAINPSVKMLYMSGAVDQFGTVLQREITEFGAKILPKPFVRSDLVGLLTGTRENLAPIR